MSDAGGDPAGGRAAIPKGGTKPVEGEARRGGAEGRGAIDNTEIRLRILFGCYAEMYRGQSRGSYLKGLAGVEKPAVAANTVYLIDKGLLKGRISRYADGQQATSVDRILAAGVDIVEEITRESVSRLDEPAGKEIGGSQDAQLAFWERCMNVARVFGIAVDVAAQVFAAIG